VCGVVCTLCVCVCGVVCVTMCLSIALDYLAPTTLGGLKIKAVVIYTDYVVNLRNFQLATDDW